MGGFAEDLTPRPPSLLKINKLIVQSTLLTFCTVTGDKPDRELGNQKAGLHDYFAKV